MVGQFPGPRALINTAGQPGNEFGALYVLGVIQDDIAGMIEPASEALTCLFIKTILNIKFQNAERQ